MNGPVSHFAQFIYQFLLFLDFPLVKDGRQFLETVFRVPVQLFYRLDLFFSLPDDDTSGRDTGFCGAFCPSFDSTHHFRIESPFIEFPPVFLSGPGSGRKSHTLSIRFVRRFVFHIFPAECSRFQTVLFCRGIAVDHGSLQVGISSRLDLEPLVSCIESRLFRHAFIIGMKNLFLEAAVSGNIAPSCRS